VRLFVTGTPLSSEYRGPIEDSNVSGKTKILFVQQNNHLEPLNFGLWFLLTRIYRWFYIDWIIAFQSD